MRFISRLSFASLILMLLGAGVVSAQSINFSLFVTVNGNSGTVANGGDIPINGQVGTQTTATVVATYTGPTQATIAKMPQIIGSSALTVATVPANLTYPLMLGKGQSLTFVVTYMPTNTTIANAQVEVQYTEPGTTTGTVPNSILLQFTGTAPAFTLSYVLETDNNVIPLAPGGTIAFTPPTQINTTAQAQLNITDTGSGQGVITGISLLSGGPVFKLSGTPLFPYLATPGSNSANLPIVISYTPTAVENDTGQIQITYQDGSTATVNLAGNGATSSYTYSYLSGTTSITVLPKGTITLPSVPLASAGTTQSTSSVILTATNKGNANGTINSVNWTGPFVVTGIPTIAPTLKPGDTENFTITYTPTQIGAQTGELVVGNDTFTLSGTGIGPQLSYAYVSNGTTILLGISGAVDFSPVAISQSQTVTFVVTNSGTSTATIPLISTSAPFSLTPTPPVLPLTLLPGKSSQFTITFTPVVTGPVTGSLLINSTIIQLAGSGNAPPALPSYTISGPTGTVSPASQQNVSLTLAASYPVDLNGVLTLTTSGDLGTDPSVQFSTSSSTGNRTVDFVIPANSTSANFAGQGSQILLQTGTVAETVTLAPTFTTAGGVDVTPDSPAVLQFTIAPAAPVLETIAATNETASSFSLVLTGYSTTRSLSTLNVTLNPASGYNLTTSQFPIDLSGPAGVWFGSSASLAFGGQFQVTVAFNLTGNPPKGQTLLQAIASVSCTIANGSGTSTSQMVNLP